MAKLLEKTFDSFNRKYFNNSLPRLSVQWSKCLDKDTLAQYEVVEYDDVELEGCARIKITHSLKSASKLWKLSLLHEMSHAKVHHLMPPSATEKQQHSGAWRIEMRRLAAMGAFDNLW